MKKTLFYIVFFIFTINLIAEDNNLNWGIQVFKNPDNYFVDNYEKHIFKKIILKFPNIKIKKVLVRENLYIVETKITSKFDYIFVFELDDSKKVKKVSRYLEQYDLNEQSVRDNIILKWLCKFFYFLDAGDDDAMYDMVFHEEIKIKFDGLSDKRKIISRLLKDFPVIIEPNSITISEESTSYVVQVTVKLWENIYLKITNKLSNLTDTHELQEHLYSRIESSISDLLINYEFPFKSSKLSKSSIKVQIIEKIKNIYPCAICKGDTITIPYPKQGISEFGQLQYLINEKQAGPVAESIFKLKQNPEKNTLIVNNSYPVSFYCSPQIKDRSLDQIMLSLQKIFNMFLQFNYNYMNENMDDVTGIVQYRGYKIHQLELLTLKQWTLFWLALQKEGSLFYYPSRIDNLENEINIQGLLYVIKDKNMDFYHFGELIAHFSKEDVKNKVKLELHFYPFLSRVGVSDFGD